MKKGKRLFLIVLGVSVMFSLFGCRAQKYKLKYDGCGFQSKKTEYAAGETVTVFFDMIATDTDYRFWLDDENVELSRDYDDRHGYVFTFTMPERDVTIHMESHNSMVRDPAVSVTFRNEVEEADVWILPQTEENRKTSLWGTPTVGKLAAGETAKVRLLEDGSAETWMVRIIDTNRALYAAQDLTLEDGYSIVFREEASKACAVIEIQDQNGTVLSASEAFSGVLGAG